MRRNPSINSPTGWPIAALRSASRTASLIMATRVTSRIVGQILPLILIWSPVGFLKQSKRSRRSEFPITAHFELLPRSPALAESGAVFEHRGFISSVFCFLGFGGSALGHLPPSPFHEREMQLCGDRVFTVLYGKSRAFRRFLGSNYLQKLILNVWKLEMKRARVTIIRCRNNVLSIYPINEKGWCLAITTLRFC